MNGLENLTEAELQAAALAWHKIVTTVYQNPYIPTSPLRPSKKQVEFLAYDGPECLFGGSAGGGKEVSLSTWMETPTGHGWFDRLKVGDVVYGTGMKPTRIVAMSEVMEGHKCYRLHFASRHGPFKKSKPEYSIVAGAEHRWKTSESQIGRPSLCTTQDIFDDLSGKRRRHIIGDYRCGFYNRLRPDGNIVGVFMDMGTEFFEVIECEPVDSVPTRCIQVDAKDGMFCAGRGCIPTHNSDALLMAALQYATVPGYSALLLRRTFRQLNMDGGLIPRSKEWIGNKAQFREKSMQWTFPSGATLTFGYYDCNDDYMLYHGGAWSFCVEKNTGIIMADGQSKKICDIRPGEMVMTIEGPKPVAEVHRIGIKPVVKVNTPAGSCSISDSHPILSVDGWDSPLALRSKECHVADNKGEECTASRQAALQPLVSQWTDRQPSGLLSSQMIVDIHHQEKYVSSKDDRIAYEEFDGERRELSPPQAWYARLRLYAPALPSMGLGNVAAYHPHASCYARIGMGPTQDCADGYRDDDDSYDEPFLSDQVVCQSNIPSRVGVLGRFHRLSHGDGLRYIPEYNRQDRRKYDHPYTAEQRPVCVELCDVDSEMVPAGEAEVWDLRVPGPSSYITSNGIIVRNCGFDELTQFKENWYLYLFSRLRKPDWICKNCQLPLVRELGGPFTHRTPAMCAAPEPIPQAMDKNGIALADVPLRMRAAANPGGPGHDHTRRRFVVPGAPKKFIRSILDDNPGISKADYIRGLGELDPVTRAQLLQGDWDAYEGGRFKKTWFREFWVEPNRNGDPVYKWTNTDINGMLHNGWPICPIGGVPVCKCWNFMTCDPAASDNDKNDYTAIGVFAVTPDGEMLVLEIVRERMPVEQIVPRIEKLCQNYDPHFVGIENVAFQLGIVREGQRSLGVAVERLNPEGKGKLVRATPAIIRASEGQIFIPKDEPKGKFPWIEDFISELLVFSGDEKLDSYSDQVDVLAWGTICLGKHGLAAPIVVQPDEDYQDRERPFIFMTDHRN